jgi:hypothetical protein
MEIVGRHQDVAVGHDNPGMGGCDPSFDDIVELGIDADAFVSDQQSRGHMRV